MIGVAKDWNGPVWKQEVKKAGGPLEEAASRLGYYIGVRDREQGASPTLLPKATLLTGTLNMTFPTRLREIERLAGGHGACRSG